MFKQRSTQMEHMDDFLLSGEALDQNLNELVTFNRWFGSKHVLLDAYNKIYAKYRTAMQNKKLLISDLGCGSGDLLQATADWLDVKNIQADLIGIDANDYMLEKAKKHTLAQSNISYQKFDIFSQEFSKLTFDIVSLNSICHHFDDVHLLKLINQLHSQVKLAIIINDLHRHWLSYFTISMLMKCYDFSALTKHDGPLSVLRAFNKHEIIALMDNLQLINYELRWKWPFRWQLIIWCC